MRLQKDLMAAFAQMYLYALHSSPAEALGARMNSLAHGAHRVILPGDKEDGQVFGHLFQVGHFLVLRHAAEHTVCQTDGDGAAAEGVIGIFPDTGRGAADPVVGGLGILKFAVVRAEH